MQFPSRQKADAFMADLTLRDAMQRAGVDGELHFAFVRESEAVDSVRQAAA